MSEQGARSFDPTPRRKEQFRKDGRFARSRDLGGTLATGTVLAVVLGSREAMGRAVQLLFARCHGDLAAIGRGDTSGASRAAMGALVVLCAPAVVSAAIAGSVAGFAQAGFHVNLEALGLKPERLNPLPRLRQMFSFGRAGIETILSLLRVGVVGYVAYRALSIELPGLLQLSRVGLDAGCERVCDATIRVITSALVALGCICVVDYAQSWLTVWREMKMTLKEVTEESKSLDGDPKVKARMRARARALARKRAIANVKTASVVIANPTHVSVALRYLATDGAPVVIAKGHDEVAMQIRAEARKHGIPILENRPLARALDAEVPIGAPIPAAHFAAVARVLAFIYRLRGGGMRRA